MELHHVLVTAFASTLLLKPMSGDRAAEGAGRPAEKPVYREECRS
jgi:hypothetical protein